MPTRSLLLPLIALALAALACNLPGSELPAEPSSTPQVVVLPTETPAPATPTLFPGTITPTVGVETPFLPPATATGQAAPATATSAGATSVKIYLIAIGDNGASGALIGCGDSLVEVNRPITATQSVLRAAYLEQLSITDEFFGESGLYNPLHQSDLSLANVTISGGVAQVQFTGDFLIGGTCDAPRVEAVLEAVALQFSSVNDVAITVNGRPLAELLSSR